MTPTEIARSLTEARKRLILALPKHGSWSAAPDRSVAVRLWYSLKYPRPLIQHKHCPKDRNEWRLSDLGLAVRAAHERMNDDPAV